MPLRDERGQHAELIELAILAEQHIAIGVAGRQQHVAAPLVDRESGGDAHIQRVRIAMIADARAHIELHAFELALALEVDDAGHRVRAVHRGRAAGDRLDAFEDELRNQIDVDDRVRVRQRQAPAVEQHEVARLAQAAQVERGASRERDGADRALRLALHELRQLIQRVLDVDRAGLRDGRFAECHDRTGRRIVRSRDARARDHHLLETLARPAALGSAACPSAAPDVSMAMIDTVPAAAVVLMRIDPPVTRDDVVCAPRIVRARSDGKFLRVYELVRLCQAALTGGTR